MNKIVDYILGACIGMLLMSFLFALTHKEHKCDKPHVRIIADNCYYDEDDVLICKVENRVDP